MRPRSLPIPRTALWLALLATLATSPPARAHRLEGEYRVLPGGKVRVEAWFETGDAPRGGKVRVFRADGTPLFAEPGELDDKGVWVFPVARAEKLRVEVSAGAGHRKELIISAAELANPGAPPPEAPPAEAAHPREHPYELPIRELLLGVTFLLALAAFVLSLRNAQQLARLRQHLDRIPPVVEPVPRKELPAVLEESETRIRPTRP